MLITINERHYSQLENAFSGRFKHISTDATNNTQIWLQVKNGFEYVYKIIADGRIYRDDIIEWSHVGNVKTYNNPFSGLLIHAL
jgi:hypothetical protein